MPSNIPVVPLVITTQLQCILIEMSHRAASIQLSQPVNRQSHHGVMRGPHRMHTSIHSIHPSYESPPGSDGSLTFLAEKFHGSE